MPRILTLDEREIAGILALWSAAEPMLRVEHGAVMDALTARLAAHLANPADGAPICVLETESAPDLGVILGYARRQMAGVRDASDRAVSRRDPNRTQHIAVIERVEAAEPLLVALEAWVRQQVVR